MFKEGGHVWTKIWLCLERELVMFKGGICYDKGLVMFRDKVYPSCFCLLKILQCLASSFCKCTRTNCRW